MEIVRTDVGRTNKKPPGEAVKYGEKLLSPVLPTICILTPLNLRGTVFLLICGGQNSPPVNVKENKCILQEK